MSKYTTELRYICENNCGVAEISDLSIDTIISKSADKIFDFDYPIFDENYRHLLNCKILKHYYTREIGLETVGLWKLKLNTKLNEIMPYYNQLYKSELFKFNPLADVDYERKSTREGTNDEEVSRNNEQKTTSKTTNSGDETRTGNVERTENGEVLYGSNVKTDGTNTGSESGHKWDTFSDTPQGTLTNVANETYLTDARKITNNNSSEDTISREEKRTGSDNTNNNLIENSSNNSVTNSQSNQDIDVGTTEQQTTKLNTFVDYVETVKGKMGTTSYTKLLMEFRESFLNIDMMIIDELSSLFFNLW